MMNLEFISVGTFKEILDALHSLLSEGTFVVDEDGIHFKATDPTMVTLVELFYGKENFEKYDIQNKMYLTLNIDLLRQALKKTKSSDKVSFIVESSNLNRLNVLIKGKSEKRFSLPILESELQEIPELNLEFKGTAEILSNTFVEAIEDASGISDEVIFSFDKENEVFSITSESELTSMEAKFTKESEGVVDIEVDESVKARYSVDYLKKISKARKVSPTVRISINQDAPARFDFKDSDDLWMYYVLAPRAEE